MAERYVLGADIGGTFTDVVHQDDTGQITIRKVPSDAAIVGALILAKRKID